MAAQSPVQAFVCVFSPQFYKEYTVQRNRTIRSCDSMYLTLSCSADWSNTGSLAGRGLGVRAWAPVDTELSQGVAGPSRKEWSAKLKLPNLENSTQ